MRVRIPFVEDSSNSSRDILRNRIRAELLPMLERDYAPGLGGRLVELAGEMRSLDDLVTAIAARELDAMRVGGGALDVSGFGALNLAVQAVVIRLFLSERMGSLRRISRAHVEAIRELILEGGPSDSIDLPGGWRAEREYNFLRLVNARERKADKRRIFGGDCRRRYHNRRGCRVQVRGFDDRRGGCADAC